MQSRLTIRLGGWAHPPTVFLLVALACSAVFLVFQVPGLWFLSDEWSFLIKRSVTGTGDDQGLFAPHNEHWSTLPILVYRVVFRLVGLTSYVPYVALSIGLHLATCGLLYLLLRRTEIHPWAASLSVVPLAFLCGGGAQNALWAFQIGFLGAAAFGLLALVLSERLGTRAGWAGVWLASVASLMSSGMGLPMLAWLCCLVLTRRGFRSALLVVLPPAVIYVVWYVAIGHTGSTDRHLADLGTTVGFLLSGLSSIWGQVILIPSVGGPMLLVLVVTALVAPATPRTNALAASGIATALVTYLLLAISRADTGVETAAKGRYVYFGLMFTLPAFAMLLSAIGSGMRGRRVEQGLAVATVALLFAASGAAQTMHYVDARLPSQIRSEQIKGAVELADSGAELLTDDVDRSWAVVHLDEVLTADVRRALPGGPVTPRGRLEAAVELQVAAQAQPFALPFSSNLLTSAVSPAPGNAPCSSAVAGRRAHVDLPPSPGGSQVAVVSAARALQVQMIGSGAVSYRRPITVFQGSRTYIASSSDRDKLRIYIGAGQLTLCRR